MPPALALGSYDAVVAAVLDILSSVVEGDGIALKTPLMDAGLDSLAASRFAASVLTRTGLEIEPIVIFEHPTAEAVAIHLTHRLRLHTPSARRVVRRPANGPSSASLGIGAATQRWPGGCTRATALRPLLHAGGEALGSPPAQRWLLEAEVDLTTLSARQLECIRHGGYVEAERFDSVAFSLSPAEVGWMDPQQRLLLEVGFASLHARGMRRPALFGSDVGHFLGMSKADWSRYQYARRGGYANYSVYATTCDSNTVASGRLSFALGLHGPCMTVDTACSSALVAMHTTRLNIHAGECDTAVVTAVRLELTLQHTLDAAFAAMLSVNGRCFTLDKRADGYVSSEGVGAFIVSVPSDESSLLINGVGAGRFLRGAVRCDGCSASLTAPNGAAQAAMLAVANQDTPSLPLLELHGTGTALGDPTETSSLARMLNGRGGEDGPIGVGGAKASFGHTMAASGVLGVTKLLLQFDHVATLANRQLRTLNPLVLSSVTSLRAGARLPTQTLGAARRFEDFCGGVSSFGYSGTIGHTVLRHVTIDCGHCAPRVLLVYNRTSFVWREAPHPFVQKRVPASDEAVIYRSLATGDLHNLVANHVVQGRVFFPGAGYLEMARAAGTSRSALSGVFFRQPLVFEATGRLVECAVTDSRFEVRSGEQDALTDAVVHCSGALVTTGSWVQVEHAAVRAWSCMRVAEMGTLYDGFTAMGLEYGPGYRTLVQAWSGAKDALARLRARATRQGTQVHPADLDDVLCAGAIVVIGESGTRLPFAVDEVQLQGTPGKLWAVRFSSHFHDAHHPCVTRGSLLSLSC